MRIDNLVNYEIQKREEALNQGPNSLAEKLANAALELIQNEEFVNSPREFLATKTDFKLTLYHKSVITEVYHISFRNIIR